MDHHDMTWYDERVVDIVDEVWTDFRVRLNEDEWNRIREAIYRQVVAAKVREQQA